MRPSRWVLAAAVTTTFLACRSRPTGPDMAALVRDLQSPNAETSGRANLALISIGEPAVPPVVELLQSDDPRIRRTAATTLWGLGPKARAAVPALSAALGDPETSFRVVVAMALENMGPDAKDAVPALVKALNDRDTEVRQRAAKALGAIGPAAHDAIPALTRATRIDPVRQDAEEAIRRIREAPAPPPEAPAPSPN